MNKQEFSKLWEECIEPTFTALAKEDTSLYIRSGSSDSLCRLYNDIKNSTKKIYMRNFGDIVKLDRHKIAACMAKAILLERPICKRLEEDYAGTEVNFVIANEVLAFLVSTAILKAYIKLKLQNEDNNGRKKAYRKICESDFIFPQTIMQVDYRTSVCWAWHHNIINGYFDVLGTANLFFMIENYSIEVYSNN
ncbi:MAG: hypothetical protein NC433_14625 [Clostridiales bacterium]|nr:hypothetical protein [Clostridiales bacterium]